MWLPMIEMKAFYQPTWAWHFPTHFSDEVSRNINKSDIFILHNEMCQHLKDLYNLLKEYFPSDKYMLVQNNDGT